MHKVLIRIMHMNELTEIYCVLIRNFSNVSAETLIYIKQLVINGSNRRMFKFHKNLTMLRKYSKLLESLAFLLQMVRFVKTVYTIHL